MVVKRLTPTSRVTDRISVPVEMVWIFLLDIACYRKRRTSSFSSAQHCHIIRSGLAFAFFIFCDIAMDSCIKQRKKLRCYGRLCWKTFTRMSPGTSIGTLQHRGKSEHHAGECRLFDVKFQRTAVSPKR